MAMSMSIVTWHPRRKLSSLLLYEKWASGRLGNSGVVSGVRQRHPTDDGRAGVAWA